MTWKYTKPEPKCNYPIEKCEDCPAEKKKYCPEYLVNQSYRLMNEYKPPEPVKEPSIFEKLADFIEKWIIKN